jgi:hypothetical protein
MMFSLNPAQARDRRIVLDKLRSIARRGLPGLWRLLKNAIRLASGRWESPANPAWWNEALREAGFEDIQIELLAHEGGIAMARRTGLRARADRPPNLGLVRGLPQGSPAVEQQAPSLEVPGRRVSRLP